MCTHLLRCCILLSLLLQATYDLRAQNTARPDNLVARIELLDERVIVEDYWYPHAAVFFKDQTILCPVSLNPYRCRAIAQPVLNALMGDGEIVRVLISRDGGKAWATHDTYLQPFSNGKGVRVELPAGVLHGFLAQMSDGSFVGMGGNIVNHLLRKRQEQIPYITTLRRFKSLDDLLAGKYEDDFPRIDVPELAFQKGDADYLYTGNVEARPTELDNGDWIVAMSGRFKEDKIRVPYHVWEAHQFRNWVCVSKDRGRSWSYLATIGDPEKSPLPKLAEGYNETDLLKLKGNTILAAMRTGGNPNPEATLERYTYLAASISHDDGKTWEAPRPMAPYGVSPRLLAMKDGTIACSSGRPGVFLIFSRDGGKTWSAPQWVTKYHAKFGECSSGYSSIGETEPGVLTVLYDDVDRDQDGKILRHVVKMARYRVSVTSPNT